MNRRPARHNLGDRQGTLDGPIAQVAEHLAANPFTDQEWLKIPPREAAQAKAAVLANPAVAYGATLLTPIFRKPVTWRVLDVMIGIVMWVIAARLALIRT